MNNTELLKIIQEMEELLVKGQKLSDKAKTFIANQNVINRIQDADLDLLLKYKSMFEDSMMWESRTEYLLI